MLSSGNNYEVIKANWRGMEIKSKLWADQREYEEEEGEVYAGISSEEEDQHSKDEGGLSVGSPSLLKNGSSTKVNSYHKLNAKAPACMPQAGMQQVEPSTSGASLMKYAAQNRTGQQQQSNSITQAVTFVEEQTAEEQAAIEQKQQSEKIKAAGISKSETEKQ